VKTKNGAIIREVCEEDWEQDGTVGQGNNKKRTYKCNKCGLSGIRSNNRRVHACK